MPCTSVDPVGELRVFSAGITGPEKIYGPYTSHTQDTHQVHGVISLFHGDNERSSNTQHAVQVYFVERRRDEKKKIQEYSFSRVCSWPAYDVHFACYALRAKKKKKHNFHWLEYNLASPPYQELRVLDWFSAKLTYRDPCCQMGRS